MAYMTQNIQDHLLTPNIISVGAGLCFCFIYAWKSGRNPSESKLKKSKNNPKSYVFLPFGSEKLASGSKNLNMTIPIETTTATTIFFGPNLSFASVTLEHKTPTKITDKILHDFIMIVRGKLTI